MNQLYQDELAQLYDVAVPDWPEEIAFYLRLAQRAKPDELSVLELACGTGRVAIQLAEAGIHVLGIDLSNEMLDLARAKSRHLPTVRWAQADMRSLNLDEKFGLALIPAYSFQLLLTKQDQAACLDRLSRHLSPGARLVLHLEHHDPDWLASLPVNDFTPFQPAGETIHPTTHELIRVSYAWSHFPSEQSLAVMIRYETIDASGESCSHTDRGPLRMYCTTLSHQEQLLTHAGFETEMVCSDFTESPFAGDTDEMIWIARKPL